MEQLIDGEFYYINTYNTFIVKSSGSNDDTLNGSHYLNLHGNYNKQGAWSIKIAKVFRLATEDEKQWLIECIEANRFIKRKLIVNQYDIY